MCIYCCVTLIFELYLMNERKGEIETFRTPLSDECLMVISAMSFISLLVQPTGCVCLSVQSGIISPANPYISWTFGKFYPQSRDLFFSTWTKCVPAASGWNKSLVPEFLKRLSVPWESPCGGNVLYEFINYLLSVKTTWVQIRNLWLGFTKSDRPKCQTCVSLTSTGAS